jgi:3-phenylpropionate/cinnamic acid dioxygenase small subunit
MSPSRDDIERLIFTYARCVDSADWDSLGALFARASVRTNTSEDVATGAEQIAGLWRGVNKVHEDGTLRTRHLITNLMFDIDDSASRANVDSYFMVFQQTARLPLQPIAGGRYRDSFARTDGAWHFQEKFIWVDQVGDTSDHLVVDVSENLVRFSDYTT